MTYLVRQLAIKKNIVDNPNARSSHTISTPRGGGIAIVVVWTTGLSYLFAKGELEEKNTLRITRCGLRVESLRSPREKIKSTRNTIIGEENYRRCFAQHAKRFPIISLKIG